MNWKFWQNDDEPQQRGSSLTDSNTLSIFGVNSSGINVTQNSAMMHTTVYACVNVKAQGLASVPYVLYKNTENGREKATKHPLYKVLGTQVSPLMTSSTWRQMVVKDIELRGTHFSQVVRDQGNRIVALYPLIYDQMDFNVSYGSDNIPKITYTYSITNGTTKTFTDKQILRIVGLPASNGLVGVTPIAQNAQSIGLGIATETFGSKFFQNGANGSGILSTEKSMKSSDSIDRLAKQFGDKYTGLNNSKKPIVLEDGMKWQPLTISNNDSQFLETRQFQKSEIASIFRVSPHLINDLKNATFSNITELSLEHVKYCLMPVAVMIESSINTQLLSDEEQKKYYSEFNFNGLMRGDFKTRTEGYKNAINAGYMTPNEARKLENLPTFEDAGDKLLIQNSYASLEEVEKKSLNEQETNPQTEEEEDNNENSN